MGFSLAIIIDDQLSRERALWITQVVKKLRNWLQVEFLKSESGVTDWSSYLQMHPEGKILIPIRRAPETEKLDAPNRIGFYTCEPLAQTTWHQILERSPSKLALQTALWNWNPTSSRLPSLLQEMRSWFLFESSPGLSAMSSERPRLRQGSVGQLIDQISVQNQTKEIAIPARRLILALSELVPHLPSSWTIEWLETAELRALRATIPTPGMRLPKIFDTIALRSRVALDVQFVRALWCKEEDLLELTLVQYPWATPGDPTCPYSYWWGTVRAKMIPSIAGPIITNGREPRLDSLPEQVSEFSLEQENAKLRALVTELKNGGVGQPKAQQLTPPDARELLEAFQARYFESKLEIRKLEIELQKPVPTLKTAALKKRMEDLQSQQQQWIRLLSETLATERKKRSS